MSSAADSQAFEMSLRDQLIAAQNNHAPLPQPHQPPANAYGAHHPQQSSPQHHHEQVMAIQSYGMPHQASDLGHPHADPSDPTAQGGAAGKKGRAQRELSNTKRAAQNRAAQRAFRMRKEQHINKLEDDLKRYLVMEDNYKALQHETFALRDYIAELQTRMTEKNITFPPAPSRAQMRTASLSAPDSHISQDDSEHVYHHADEHHDQLDPHDQQSQHDQRGQHHYADVSPPQSHAASPNAYPMPTFTATNHQPHHQHAPATSSEHVHHDPVNDPLPAAAISQLQAAAAQAGDMEPSHTAPPTLHDQQQQAHPQDPQYVRASEYPAHKRPRLDSPPRQTCKFELSTSDSTTLADS
ncbi:hypothetical protein E4T42_06222 [Aureobasidium subglaciale]|nr:hypothetical protein E4T42_06222 [Aureobasidium subglaciale]